MSKQLQKLVIGMTGASIALLVLACGILFAVAWNSMMTVNQLRNENRTLALMVNACSTRLENEGIQPLVPQQVMPSPASPPAELAKPQTAPVKSAEESAKAAVKTEPTEVKSASVKQEPKPESTPGKVSSAPVEPQQKAESVPGKAKKGPATAEAKLEPATGAKSPEALPDSVVVEGVSVALPKEQSPKK